MRRATPLQYRAVHPQADEPDRQLEEKLKAEWPGILRWMIDGCLDWQANGLVRPASVSEATHNYFEDQDVFRQWLEDECEVDPGNDYKWERSTDLFASWSAYAKAAGEHPGSLEELRPRHDPPWPAVTPDQARAEMAGHPAQIAFDER